jgi:uncharacterized repeat protein (TIGR03847 family)
MSPSFDLPAVDRFTTGTVGPPGQRVFYLQARTGAQIVTLRLEKLQVAALAQHLADRLSDLAAPDTSAVPDDPHVLELEEPVAEEWIVGGLAVSYDEDDDRVFVIAEEFTDEEEDEDGIEDIGLAATNRGVARFGLTREQVAAFIVRAATVVASGRPPCDLCGNPLDPEGHVCVKTNGHRTR